jgi:hypothetical protein
MKFQTSPDDEHVCLALLRGRSTLDLGEQTLHYLLLLLARQRLADVARGTDPMSQGWVEFDTLVQMLDMDKRHLDTQVFRLRKEFEPAVSQGYIQHDFIERRKGGLRLGNVAIEIWRGAQMEGTWRPDAAARFAA